MLDRPNGGAVEVSDEPCGQGGRQAEGRWLLDSSVDPSLKRYHVEVQRRVAAQLWVGSALLIGCVACGTVLELVRFPERRFWLLGLDAAVLATAALALTLSRVFPTRSVGIAIAAVNLLGLILNGYHAAVGAPLAVAMWTLTGLLCSSALFLAWGWRPQLFASVGALVGYSVQLPASPEPFLSWVTGEIYLAWVVALSVAGAALIDRYLRSQFDLVSALKEREGRLEQALACEQAARRDAEAASRAKDEFLAVVSHELRTPLTAILGWTPLLREASLGPEERRHGFDTIERNGRTLVQLIEDLLDVARIVSGKLRLGVRAAELGPILRAAVDAMRLAADAKRVELELHLPEQPEYVLGDPDRLQQVVWNLVSNAIKFTPAEGRVAVELSREGQEVVIRVQDSGRGIAPEFLPHVFERFWQADATTTRRHSGLGLGLAIVRYLVELHGGKVAAESPESGGAIFSVRLPAHQAPAALADRASAGATAADAVRGIRVLVVDDELDAQDITRRALELYGVEVRTASSSKEALAILERWAPTVLLSDIAMPDEDGYALIRRVRERESAHGGQLPAVAFTALARADDRSRALAAGFNGYLAKPVDPTELIDAIAMASGGSPPPASG